MLNLTSGFPRGHEFWQESASEDSVAEDVHVGH